jgi:DNA replication protein DnaC
MINLFSRFNNGPLTYYDIIIMSILAVFIVLLDNDKYEQLLNMYNKIILYFRNYTSVEIIGWETFSCALEMIEYPNSIIAINHYIYTNNKGFEYKYFNIDKNGVRLTDDLIKALKNKECNYLLTSTKKEIELYEDIYIMIQKSNQRLNDGYTITTKISMKLISYNHSVKYIDEFINRCILEYNDYMDKKIKNKCYHFIYQGKKNDKMIFASNIISSNDKIDSNCKNYETFDSIFHSNKNMIMKDIDRLHDLEYYKKTGMRRKKGYLFYGLPGTGKTSTVMAMSNYDNRHIIEVPYDRVKTNEEFESILSLKKINDIKLCSENIIILFDELDMKNRKEIKSDSESDSESES